MLDSWWDPLLLEHSLMEWRTAALCYCMRDLPATPALPSDLVVEVVTQMVHGGCFYTSADRHFEIQEESVGGVVCQVLGARGLVELAHLGSGLLGARLTLLGMQSISTSWLLSDPAPVCGPRALPLKECTTYELMRRLLDEGWEWRQLPSRRARKAEDALRCVKPGGAKIWCTSSVNVSREYLMTLLRSED